MKKVILLLTVLFSMILDSNSFAAEMSNDKMTLEWNTSKVWMVGNELCAQGTFTNKRSDFRITEINDMTVRFVFVQENGEKVEYIAKPKFLPMCKIPPNGSKKMTLNFGKYEGARWKKWLTTQEYIFSYQEGMRW